MTKQPTTEQLADELENTPFMSTRYEAAAKLRRLEAANAELLEALKVCEKTIDRLWVSHHANAADHALDLSRAAIKKHGGAA